MKNELILKLYIEIDDAIWHTEKCWYTYKLRQTYETFRMTYVTIRNVKL